MEAPHDPFFTAFGPNTVMLPELGITEPSQPTELDRRKVRQFYQTQRVWSLYNTVGMCDFAAAPINVITMTKLVEQVRELGELVKRYKRLSLSLVHPCAHGAAKVDCLPCILAEEARALLESDDG